MKKRFVEMLKEMTLREKMQYLWDYYRWVLVVAAVAVVIISIVVTGIVNSRQKILYGGAAVNVSVSEEGITYLTHDWERQLGAVKNQEAELFITSFEDLQTTPDVAVSSSMAMQVVLKIAGEELDYVLMDEVAYNFYKNHPIFTPLDQLFDSEVLSHWADATVYHETQEEGRYPIALDITDTAFAGDCISGGGRVYIAFPGNTDRTEYNADFLTYLLNWK